MAFESPPIFEGTWRTYTPSDGLAALKCEHLLEDRQGYLWIATCTGGISRFDGDTFKTYTTGDGLCGTQVYSVLEDHQGRIWCGTFDGGLCYFDGRHFHWVDTCDPLSGNAITYLFEDSRRRLWCAGPSLIGYLSDDRFYNLFPQVLVDCGMEENYPTTEYFGIAEDSGGAMWFGGNSRMGLLKYDGDHFNRIIPPGQGESPRFFPVHSDAKDRIWIGGDQQNLWRVVDGTLQPQRLDLGGTQSIRKIQTDRQGRLWLCTVGNGVYCLDGEELQHYTRADGLGFDVVNGMLEDREGLLWFATWGGGLSCYDPLSVRVYVRPSKSSVLALPRSSTDPPMSYHFSDELQTRTFAFHAGRLVYPDNTPAEAGYWYALYRDETERLWLGTESGLCQYRDNAFVSMNAECGLASDPVHAIDACRTGGLLLGRSTVEGQLQLVHWDGQASHVLYTLETSRHHRQYISAVCQTEAGDIWFGINLFSDHGSCQGLFRIKGTEARHYAIADGLPDNRISDLLQDHQGNIWVATLGGISRFDGDGFTTFTTEQGLPNNHIRCLHMDGQGSLWLGSESGLIRYCDGCFQPVLPQSIGVTHKIVSAPDGTLWCGTSQGLVNYTPSQTPPRVRIDQLVADQVYPNFAVEPIVTTARQVTVEYRGMSLRSLPQHMLYTWRLVGRDLEWQRPTRQFQAILADLSPGEYTFQVRAIDCDFNESVPAEINFTVQPDPLVQGLHHALNQADPDSQFIGDSETLQWINSQLATVATTELNVLILGETGTGKGLAARALHALSNQSGLFIQVNCGAIPPGLVESELFGHEKGAFTGANARQLGKFELATGGTLFLDEIGDMPQDLQRVLLQVLQERTFHRVGGRELLHTDARIIAATNRDLAQAVKDSTFRQDLYYRLGVFEVRLPPLRQRREDIPPLVAHFAARFAHHLHRPVPTIDPAALDLFCAYDWPGNVRELEHIVQRALLLCQGDRIGVEDLAQLAPAPAKPQTSDVQAPPDVLAWLAEQNPDSAGKDLLANADELLIRAALAQTKGNKSEAAKLLGTGRKRIERRAKKYCIS
jgi:DNA-binding NtrC family response regulator/ligand-binding sensor domain-containing protein